MRLWHYELIKYIPNSQLLSQWRELNSIYKKQDKHILINYIYEYPKDDLYNYSLIIIGEMNIRGFEIKSFDGFNNYFHDGESRVYIFHPFKNHHNDRYLIQCYYNLQEKYDRGQKDFNKELYDRLTKFLNDKNKCEVKYDK